MEHTGIIRLPLKRNNSSVSCEQLSVSFRALHLTSKTLAADGEDGPKRNPDRLIFTRREKLKKSLLLP
jgi:hypothetical protein